MLRRGISGIVLALILMNMFAVVADYPDEPHDANSMWIEPSNITLYTTLHTVGYRFNVTVWLNVSSVPSTEQAVNAWETGIAYERAYLNATRTGYTAGATSQFFENISTVAASPLLAFFNDTHGFVQHGESWSSVGPRRTLGYGSLNWIEFEVVAAPPEYANITSTIMHILTGPRRGKIYDAEMNNVPFTPYHASYLFLSALGHDVAVTEVTPSSSSVVQGQNVGINVTVKNQGSYTETFDVKAYANATAIGSLINITLPSKDLMPLTLMWNTTGATFGHYVIWAEVSVVLGETDTSDNTLMDGEVLVRPAFHDVAVTNVRTSQNLAYQGENVSIYVDVWNAGDFTETFNVTTYADEDSTIIGDEITVEILPVILPSRSSTSLVLAWNTTDVSPNNYTISAVASNVTGEADPSNNIYENGKIGIFASVPCLDINITSPTHVELNPSIFHFDWAVRALEISLGNMTINSTGYGGPLRVLGSTNGTIHLRVDQPNLEYANYNLAENSSVNVPLWLLFDPGTYSGTYELQLTVCGVHRLKITVNIVHIWVCSNGAYSVAGGTATFNWTVTGGSLVYLVAELDLPPEWSYTVDPPIGVLFDTPYQISVNITASPEAVEGDVGSVTLRAYKNETGMLIWQYTFFSAIDNNPPIIENVQQPTLTFNGMLLFNTTVRDASGIESVQLYYSVNDGPWSNETMRWDSGDTFNSTAYTWTVPHVPDNSTIRYYVAATDWLRNQTQSDVETLVVNYDLAITEVKTSKTAVGQGFATQINVSVANQGTIPQTSPKVVIYANTTPIFLQTLPLLTNGNVAALAFYWNTTGVSKGEYVITAFAIPLLDETDTADNTLIGSTIRIGIPGDVDPADGYVGIDDIFALASHFGQEPIHPDWNGTYDINDDNYVGIDDIFIAASHFGEEEP